MQKISSFLLALVSLILANGQAAEVIHLGIGTQDSALSRKACPRIS
jgi:hypothetical protein